ncbi:zinc fingers and homeoboxes protein 3 [Salminus brasiliensis]|uniref:zinc fingers and homeoboxes protein 3 n=1 Tax=Salminus brasiliensis TaxID=930266 RepID=UPI003B82E818
MASKRKSTIPCMIPVKTMHLQDELEKGRHSPSSKESSFFHKEEASGKGFHGLDESSGQDSSDAHKDGGTYTCRPCNFETQDLNLFLDHVYSGHPEFRSDPTFLCVDCGVSAVKFEGLALHNARVHPSTMTTTLQLKKKDRKVTVEQSLVVGAGESAASKESEISITKTPIMKMLKGKSEPKRIVVSHPVADEPVTPTAKQVEPKDSPAVTVTHVPTIVHNGAASKVTLPSAIQIVNGSGALPMLKTAMTQVVSVVQNRSLNQQSSLSSSSSSSSSSTAASSKNLPKVMIPLSSIPTYNASMDSSSFLKTSFSKFPYPTKAELCYLTVVTKYPEEQIKIWFTAQRLKQGISWSPEEIEDARRKMFNTIIQTAPPAGQQQQQQQHRQSQAHHSTPQQTITVLPASLGATGIPHILQGSLVGQGGVIVTQPMMANGIQVSSAPVALAVTPKPQAAAKPTMQAKPAAALVADKGLSMVVGSVGSSNSGNYTISNSSSGGGGSSSSSSSSSSNSSSIASSILTSASTNSSLSSHTSVISISSSSSGKLNNSNSNNSKASIPSTNGRSSTPSNGNAKTVNDNKNSTNGKGSAAKSSVDSKGSADPKGNTKNSSENKSGSGGGSPSVPVSTSPAPTATTDVVPSKSDSPSPASANSRTLATTSFLDPSFYKAKKSQEQLLALKESFLISQFPNQEEVDRLTSLTGLTVREVRKWFSDRRYHFRNLKGSRSSTGGQTPANSAASSSAPSSTAAGDVSDSGASTERPKTPQKMPLSPSRQQQQQTTPPTPTRRTPRPPSPDFTAIRYKEREPHQVRALEASFAQDPDPSGDEVDRLRGETKMTRREIHGWFADRRRRVAAEKKKEELERAEREEDDNEEEEEEEEKKAGEEGEKGKEEAAEGKDDAEEPLSETQQQGRDDSPGTEPKVNPIKINLKMLKVTESNGKGELEGSPQPETNKVPPSAPQTSTPPPSQPPHTAYRGKKTPEQLHLLKQAFARTHWPSSPLYNELIAKTGLPRPEVVRWFGDCRYVLKNGQLKWLESYQSMVDEEDFQKGDLSALQEHFTACGKLVENQLEELVKSSGLSEELVRRWFTRQTKASEEGPKSEDAEAVEVKASPSAAKGKAALPSAQRDEEVKEEQMEQSVTNVPSKDQTTKATTGEAAAGEKEGSD